MTRGQVVPGVLALLVAMSCATPASAAEKDAGQAFNKLSRGVVNAVTGWVEVPKRIHETHQTSGPVSGFTWGLLRGLGHGVIRTAAGLYEVLTFPFPAPAGYAPLVDPEYVFTQTESADDPYEY